MTAVSWMKEGKKVRRRVWSVHDFYITMDKKADKLNTFDNDLYISDYVAVDWEIYEEPKKTLYDKRLNEHCLDGDYDLTSVDVKEALKEFIEADKKISDISWHKEIVAKLKEIFGEELVE